jgi:hypothetical protein
MNTGVSGFLPLFLRDTEKHQKTPNSGFYWHSIGTGNGRKTNPFVIQTPPRQESNEEIKTACAGNQNRTALS